MFGGTAQGQQKLRNVCRWAYSGTGCGQPLAQVNDPGDDGIDLTGLADQIFNAKPLGAAVDIAGENGGGRQNHGADPFGAGPFQQRQPIQLRKHQIQQENIGILPAQDLQRFGSGAAAQDMIAIRQRVDKRCPVIFTAVCNQKLPHG